MKDPWTDRLSEYVDGTLGEDDLMALVEHLHNCDACRVTIDELRAVVATATTLEDREPETDLWPGIADRIRAAHTGETPVVALAARRRFTFTVPQLAAAAGVLLMAGASATFLAVRSTSPAGDPEIQAAIPANPEFLPAGMVAGGVPYETAVAELAEALEEHSVALNPATVLVLERSLAVIDSAIAEAQAALRQEPNDQYLNAHLAHSKQRKLELLTRAVNIATASS
jgi:anti-sigma factor RsiW